jgi:hypothetical protein
LSDIANEYARLAKVQEDKRDFHLAKIEELKDELKTLNQESNDIRGALVDAQDGNLKNPARARRALAAIGVGLPENATDADILAAINANREKLEGGDKDITARIPEIKSEIEWHKHQASIADREAERLREAEDKVRREIERLKKLDPNDPETAKEYKRSLEEHKDEVKLVATKSDDIDLREKLDNLNKQKPQQQNGNNVVAAGLSVSNL